MWILLKDAQHAAHQKEKGLRMRFVSGPVVHIHDLFMIKRKFMVMDVVVSVCQSLLMNIFFKDAAVFMRGIFFFYEYFFIITGFHICLPGLMVH